MKARLSALELHTGSDLRMRWPLTADTSSAVGRNAHVPQGEHTPNLSWPHRFPHDREIPNMLKANAFVYLGYSAKTGSR